MNLLAAIGIGLPVELVVVLYCTCHFCLYTSLHELYSASLATAFALQPIQSYSPIMSSEQSATIGKRLVHSHNFGLHACRFQDSSVPLSLPPAPSTTKLKLH